MDELQRLLEEDGFYPDHILADGEIQRFKRDSNSDEKSAWYICFENNSYDNKTFYIICYNDWKESHVARKKSTLNKVEEKNPHNQELIKKRIEEAVEKKKIARAIEKAACKELSGRIWSMATDIQETPYTIRKKISGNFGVKSQLMRSDGRSLVVPLCNEHSEIVGLQYIHPDGSKKFEYGTPKQGNYFEFRPVLSESQIIYLVEGFATGATLFMALPDPIFVAFDAGNLVHASKTLKRVYPKNRIIICGDDDRFSTENKGREAALKASREIKCDMLFPVFKELVEGKTDFNDLHSSEGLDVVRSQIDKFLNNKKKKRIDFSKFVIEEMHVALLEPDEEEEWLIDQLLIKRGTSVLAGKAKLGKSSFARQMMLQIVRGKDFLGYESKKGTALYLSAEEPKGRLKRQFRKLGMVETDRGLFFHSGGYAPMDPFERVKELLEIYNVDFVLLDTFQKFFPQIKNISDYSEVGVALQELTNIAMDHETHIMVLHHAKKGDTKGQDSILGSSAINGGVDTMFIMGGEEGAGKRSLSITSRHDFFLEETELKFDEMTKRIEFGESKGKMSEAMLRDQVINLVRKHRKIIHSDVLNLIGKNKQSIISILTDLTLAGVLQRVGKGVKTDPFIYNASY